MTDLLKIGMTVSYRSRAYTVVEVDRKETNTYAIAGGMRAISERVTLVSDELTILRDIDTHPFYRDSYSWAYVIDESPDVGGSKCADLLARAEQHQSTVRERMAAERTERERIASEQAAHFAAKRPTWAKSVIVAELTVSDCDSMTDYFASHTERTLILAWSKHTRDLFPEMRKAAKNAPETRDVIDWKEHREKYSMGHGYYLSETNGYHGSGGWVIRKNRWDVGRLAGEDRLPGATTPRATVDSSDSDADCRATVTENDKLDGIEITFTGKPHADIRSALKASGWRWSRRQGLWYHKRTDAALAFARQLAASCDVSQCDAA